MKLYLSNSRTWTGTQADAKAAQGGPDFESIEVPTDKPGLIAWLNEEWEAWYQEIDRRTSEAAAGAPPARVEAAAPPSPPPPPTKAPPAASGSITEQIMALEGGALFGVLQAAIDRLHETAGPKGWQQFAKHVTGWGGGSIATDRGLGMLVLAGLANSMKEDV